MLLQCLRIICRIGGADDVKIMKVASRATLAVVGLVIGPTITQASPPLSIKPEAVLPVSLVEVHSREAPECRPLFEMLPHYDSSWHLIPDNTLLYIVPCTAGAYKHRVLALHRRFRKRRV